MEIVAALSPPSNQGVPGPFPGSVPRTVPNSPRVRIPSLAKTFPRWYPAVRGLTNSRVAFVSSGTVDKVPTKRARVPRAERLEPGRGRRPAGEVRYAALGAAQGDPDLVEALSAHDVERRRHLAVEQLGLAQRRGEIRPDVDREAVVDQLRGACCHRLLLPALPVTTKFVDELIDTVFAGIRVTSGGENSDLPAPLVRVWDPGGGLVERPNGSRGESSPRHGGHA